MDQKLLCVPQTLTQEEKRFVRELRDLISADGEKECNDEFLTNLGTIAQKLAASHKFLNDYDDLDAVMAALMKLSESKKTALVQNVSIIRGIFAGDKNQCIYRLPLRYSFLLSLLLRCSDSKLGESSCQRFSGFSIVRCPLLIYRCECY